MYLCVQGGTEDLSFGGSTQVGKSLQAICLPGMCSTKSQAYFGVEKELALYYGFDRPLGIKEGFIVTR